VPKKRRGCKGTLNLNIGVRRKALMGIEVLEPKAVYG
jgi:hypothetical protein